MRSLFCAFAIICAPMMAFAETFDCTLGQDGWFGKRMIFQISSDGKTAKMDGDVARHFTGGAMDVQMTANNDKRVTFKWEVNDSTSSTGQGANRLLYKMTITKGDRRIQGTMFPQGYDNNFSANGKCS